MGESWWRESVLTQKLLHYADLGLPLELGPKELELAERLRAEGPAWLRSIPPPLPRVAGGE